MWCYYTPIWALPGLLATHLGRMPLCMHLSSCGMLLCISVASRQPQHTTTVHAAVLLQTLASKRILSAPVINTGEVPTSKVTGLRIPQQHSSPTATAHMQQAHQATPAPPAPPLPPFPSGWLRLPGPHLWCCAAWRPLASGEGPDQQ